MFENPVDYNAAWSEGESIHSNLARAERDLSQEGRQDDYDTVLECMCNEDVFEFQKFQEALEGLLLSGRYEEVLRLAKNILTHNGLDIAKEVPVGLSESSVLIAEAVNLGAKVIDYDLYRIKPAVIVSAWKNGAQFGFNKGDGTYTLFHPSVGAASFHDPSEEIRYIIEDLLGEKIPEWPHEWSGIYRQDEAFDLLKDFFERKGLLENMAQRTTPPELIKQA